MTPRSLNCIEKGNLEMGYYTDRTKRADEVLRAALEQAFNSGLMHKWGSVSQNDVDAFTAALADAGIDLAELDEVLTAQTAEAVR